MLSKFRYKSNCMSNIRIFVKQLHNKLTINIRYMKTLKKINDELEALSSKVDMNDKMRAAIHFNVHVETISRYLRREARKEAFGLELLAFLKDIVEKREEILHEIK